jgi:UrcA family protein
MKKSFYPLMPAAILVAFIGLTSGPVLAQQTQTQQTLPKWKPSLESVIVQAARLKNYRVLMSNTRLGEAFAVTASLEVPYSDLHLAREADAAEFGRRINVAARLVCMELDAKYPPALYPVVEGDDCQHNAAKDGMDRANQVIAAAKN